MAAPIAAIDQNGITTPLFTDVLTYFQQQYQAIYGADIDLDPDTQDGQWIAVMASAIHDANMTITAVYHTYSPTFAQGAGLSSLVKINGIRRQRSTTSTVVVRCVGVAGREIGGGIIGDNLNLGTQWQLPPSVTIPPEGQIDATATSMYTGAIKADIGTLTEILTPVPGWQTVTNPAGAIIGAPVEIDATLRRRQTQSVANPSQSVLVGIQGAIENLAGVERVLVYENPTGGYDVNGIPPYSMAAVVEGGDVTAIATSIVTRKTPGSPTYGDIHSVVIDDRGVPNIINFFELRLIPVSVYITLRALPGFTETVEQEIIASVVAYLKTLPIGFDSYYSKLIAATQLPEPDGLTYDVVQVWQSRGGAAFAAADIAMSFVEAATSEAALVTIAVQ